MNVRAPDELVSALWAAWRDRDIAAVAAFVTDDVYYTINIPTEVVPFGGATVGKRALSDRLRTMADHDQVLRFDGVVTSVNGDTIRGFVRFSFKHRATGQVNENSMRQVFTLRDGLVCRLETFVDQEGIRAFQKLVAYAVPFES